MRKRVINNMNLIFASQNKGKTKEIKSLFNGTGIEIYSLSDLGNDIDVPETGETFEENAFIKAKAIYDIYDVPVIADDSGLAIEQLDGRPGVYSARYSGENCTYEDNNKKVISELENLPEPHLAKFISHAVFYDGTKKIDCVGELPGKIILDIRGTEGFGYDPIFIPDGFDKTISELTFEEKNNMSHRKISFTQLKEKLLEYLNSL
ncbi:MAG: RdgB/HAM1 family non-canonical purine NTP pyrophosphatase [Melioribacteraceae bacterium]|nr:RdgB/HAM1 family non-canonical purine NTP pyrophosphatase [Melioribacteraceae bacterium]